MATAGACPAEAATERPYGERRAPTCEEFSTCRNHGSMPSCEARHSERESAARAQLDEVKKRQAHQRDAHALMQAL
jgi:hypothetical protein